jgi:hypothetical protein
LKSRILRRFNLFPLFFFPQFSMHTVSRTAPNTNQSEARAVSPPTRCWYADQYWTRVSCLLTVSSMISWTCLYWASVP